ncbi:transposase [Streptomyces sp. NPDC087659]|uniref:transposase n=1 Tax=Streptomyces sp. NPDC087659 TaxID=3365801 RepID=UPI00380E347C
MSVRDIRSHLAQVSLAAHVHRLALWVKNRSGSAVSRPVYLAVGVDMDGRKDVLGLWARAEGTSPGRFTPDAEELGWVICCRRIGQARDHGGCRRPWTAGSGTVRVAGSRTQAPEPDEEPALRGRLRKA